MLRKRHVKRLAPGLHACTQRSLTRVLHCALLAHSLCGDAMVVVYGLHKSMIRAKDQAGHVQVPVTMHAGMLA